MFFAGRIPTLVAVYYLSWACLPMADNYPPAITQHMNLPDDSFWSAYRQTLLGSDARQGQSILNSRSFTQCQKDLSGCSPIRTAPTFLCRAIPDKLNYKSCSHERFFCRQAHNAGASARIYPDLSKLESFSPIRKDKLQKFFCKT